jgi:AcrR family transcriptional regulator
MNERPPGLRERKKAKMRAAIQRTALRLFREQGYEATSISQIAAAAEVSESSFFRYFPTKEDVIRWDELDPQIIEAFKRQPAGPSPIQALRLAFRQVLGQAPQAVRAELRERAVLVLSVLPLRETLLDQVGGPLRPLAEAVAERAGRQPGDPAVRTLVGAMMGVCVSALMAAADDSEADLVVLLDEAMALLEAGLPV